MTTLKAVICPGCKEPLRTRDWKDTLFICPCGTLHSRDDMSTIVEYEAGMFTKQGSGEKVYLPFWKLDVDFYIQFSHSEGGMLSKFADFFKGNSNSGNVTMMIPAFELNPLQFKDMAKRMTMQYPAFTSGSIDPGVKREPCVVTADMTDRMADFLFVTIEAEKPGTLQSLAYSLTVKSKKVVYLPYYRSGSGIQPGY